MIATLEFVEVKVEDCEVVCHNGSDAFDLVLLGAAGSGGSREGELRVGAVGYVLLEFGLELGDVL